MMIEAKEPETLKLFKEDILDAFRRVTLGVDGVISSRCGEFEIRKGFGGRIELSPAAARLLVERIDQ